MYCHWALHVSLSNPSTTSAFLQRVDAFIRKTVHPYTEDPAAPFSFIDEHQLFREFVYLDSFPSQLRELLDRYSLPANLCESDTERFTFLAVYAGVIEDGELSVRGRRNQHLEAVERVVFRKGDLSSWPASHTPFSLRWDIHLRDGRVCEAQLSANDTATGISHRLLIRGSAVPGIRWNGVEHVGNRPQDSDS